MKLSLIAAAAAVAVLCASGVVAQQDPIAARKALMKANNDNAKIAVAIMRGNEPFDAAKVNAAFDQWADTAKKFGALFPDSSKTGDTRALPAVWTERAKFDAEIAKFAKDIADTRAKAASGVDGLKAAMAVIGKDCGSCHETFRRPQ
jgi:cytochrome c556